MSTDSNATILIVDQHANDRHYTAEILSSSGYQTKKAAHVAEALTLLPVPDEVSQPSCEIEVVLFDLQTILEECLSPDHCPIRDWIQSARQNFTPIISVLVMTPEQQDKAAPYLGAGAFYQLLKPLHPTTLLHTLHEARRRIALADLVDESYKQIYANRTNLQDIQHEVDQLKVNLSESEKINQQKEQFLAMMSHELRTPLTSMIGYTELLNETDLTADQQELLHNALTSAKSTMYIINDMIDISRIRNGRLILGQKKFDLHQTVDEMIDLFKDQASLKGIDLKFIHHGSLSHMVVGDELRFSQILFNILGNAVKFTPPMGAVNLSLNTSTTEDNESAILVEIADNGPGISKAAAGRIFQLFEQEDSTNTKQHSGTGLGLYMSKSLLDLMDGEIWYESEPGKGTSFFIKLNLPLSETPLPTLSAPVEEEKPEQTMLERPAISGLVLVAEDTPYLQILAHRLIEDCGAQVTIAKNGAEAVEKVKKDHFDLILMDIHMPVMNGIDAAKAIKAKEPEIPIYALSADVSQQNIEQFLAAGCDGFIGKPINRRDLYGVLEEHLPQAEEIIEDNDLLREELPESFVFLTNDEEDTEEDGGDSGFDDLIDDEAISIFHQFCNEAYGEIQEAMLAKDWPQLRDTVHALAGGGTTFGFPAITDLSNEIKTDIDHGETQQLEDKINRLLTMLKG